MRAATSGRVASACIKITGPRLGIRYARFRRAWQAFKSEKQKGAPWDAFLENQRRKKDLAEVEAFIFLLEFANAAIGADALLTTGPGRV